MNPTPEQLERLRQFAQQYGPAWKEILITMWGRGTDMNEQDGYLLHQIRNQYGPSWLMNFKPKEYL